MKLNFLLIPILFLALFLASVENQLLIPLLPLLSRQFAISMKVAGWLFSVYALSAAVFTFLLGSLLDRFGRVKFLTIGLALLTAASFFLSQASSIQQVFLLRAISGAASGLSSAAIAGLVGDYFPYERRGRVMGIILSSYFAALILGIPAGAWLAEEWNWRIPFFAFSFAAGLLFLLALTVLPQLKTYTNNPALEQPRSYWEILSNLGPVSALFASLLISGGTVSFMAFMSVYLDSNFGLSTVEISKIFLIAGLAAIVSSPFSGWMSDRFSKRGVFLVTNSFLAIPLLLITFLAWGWEYYLLLFLISVAVSFRQTALQTLQTELVPFHSRGSYLALRNCFSQLGISIATFFSAILYGSFGYMWVTIFSAVLMIGGSLAVQFFVNEPARTVERDD